MKCPLCKQDTGDKVLYMGFPMKLCTAEKCSCLWGFWAFIAYLLPVVNNGYFTFMGYKGSYWLALWYWIRYGTDGLNERR